MKNNQNKISRLFLPSGCLSEEAIELYLSKVVDENEKLAIEEHLESCEMCAAAVEGYRIFLEANPREKVAVVISNLKQQISDRGVRFQSRRYLRPFLAVAAMLIILFASIFLFRMLYTDKQPVLASLSEPQISHETLIINAPAEIKPSLKPEVQSNKQIIQPTTKGQGTIVTDDVESQMMSPVVAENEKSEKDVMSKTELMEAPKKEVGTLVNISAGVSGGVKSVAIPPENDVSRNKYTTQDAVAKQDSFYQISSQAYKESTAVPQSKLKFKASNQKPGYNAAEEPISTSIEVSPEFPGGQDSLNRFYERNLKFPEADVQSIVFVSFYVETDGSLTDIKIKKGIGGGCDEEALRVVKLMPKWIPGNQNGKAVRALKILPVKFKIIR